MWLFQIFFSNFRKVFELFLVCKLDKTMLEPDATLVQIKQTATQHQTQWSYYRMAKFKSAESFWCNTSTTSKASKGQWWKFELCDTSTTNKASKAKWWNFELLAESLFWHPCKIIDVTQFFLCSVNIWPIKTASTGEIQWVHCVDASFYTKGAAEQSGWWWWLELGCLQQREISLQLILNTTMIYF